VDGSRQLRRHTLKADPASQLRLLELQATDSALDRIAHRLRTLPEIARLAELTTILAGIEGRIAVAEAEVSDLQRAQARIDADVEQVRARMGRDQQRMDTGAVSSPKELEQLQHEIESLRRRQSSLEDDELEIMAQVEAKEVVVAALRREQQESSEAFTSATASKADAEERAAIEAADLRGQRADHVAALPADLLKLYDKLRADGLSVAAAKLHRRTCQGCHMELPSTDLGAMAAAPEDEVLRCESCRAVLVRTADSGLG
jgi:predicted  nucleic acid-binding Zn-ribbon protein